MFTTLYHPLIPDPIYYRMHCHRHRHLSFRMSLLPYPLSLETVLPSYLSLKPYLGHLKWFLVLRAPLETKAPWCSTRQGDYNLFCHHYCVIRSPFLFFCPFVCLFVFLGGPSVRLLHSCQGPLRELCPLSFSYNVMELTALNPLLWHLGMHTYTRSFNDTHPCPPTPSVWALRLGLQAGGAEIERER